MKKGLIALSTLLVALVSMALASSSAPAHLPGDDSYDCTYSVTSTVLRDQNNNAGVSGHGHDGVGPTWTGGSHTAGDGHEVTTSGTFAVTGSGACQQTDVDGAATTETLNGHPASGNNTGTFDVAIAGTGSFNVTPNLWCGFGDAQATLAVTENGNNTPPLAGKEGSLTVKLTLPSFAGGPYIAGAGTFTIDSSGSTDGDGDAITGNGNVSITSIPTDSCTEDEHVDGINITGSFTATTT